MSTVLHSVEDFSSLEFGTKVSGDEIAAISGQVQMKGIHPLGEYGVALLCTISGEYYNNQWLNRERSKLIYYMERRKDKYDINYKSNQAILKASNAGKPIYLFVRNSKGVPFVYEGVFMVEKIGSQAGIENHFILVKDRETEEDVAQQEYESKHKEGVERRVMQTVKERSPKLRKSAIRKYGQTCMVCEFNFDTFYGKDFADSYIELHHTKPLAEVAGERETRLGDVIVICSNCHRVIHRKKNKLLSWQELKKNINKP